MTDELVPELDPLRIPAPTLMLLFLYFAEFFFSALNHRFFLMFERVVYGDALVNAHATFTILGALAFFLVGSPMLFLPYRYGSRMRPKSQRNYRTLCVMIAFLLHDFPIWMVEFWLAWQYGVVHVLQGVSVVLVTITTAFGFFAAWLGYAWKVSRVLQHRFGDREFQIGQAVANGLALPRV